MKRIAYTQRVEIIERYGERRDCADQEIADFLWECGYLPIAVNNIPSKIYLFMNEIKPEGIVLTGGNDLVKYGGNAPERDETEKKLIDYGLENNIPIYGFCRGMQIIADYFGAKLIKVSNHAAMRHMLDGNYMWDGREVNSFHNMAVNKVTLPLIVEAKSEDGVIEAFRHENKKVFATMWHPEREKPYVKEDLEFVKEIFL